MLWQLPCGLGSFFRFGRKPTANLANAGDKAASQTPQTQAAAAGKGVPYLTDLCSLFVVCVVTAFAITNRLSLLPLLVVVVPHFGVAVCFHICVCCTVWAFFFSSFLHRVECKC